MSVAPAMPSVATKTVSRNGNMLAAIIIGAMIKTANGLTKPPVKNKSAQSCVISKAINAAASRSLKIRCGENRIMVKRFNHALAAIAPRQRPNWVGKPRAKWTMQIAAVCPATASQRIEVNVRRRTGPRNAFTASRRSGIPKIRCGIGCL